MTFPNIMPMLFLNAFLVLLVGRLIESHKTARPGARSLLPVTANAFGIGQGPWAACWLRARAAVGLAAAKQGTLMPTAADDGWHDVALKTTEFAAQLRSLLLELGFSHDDLEHVGAHSLKVTCLAWSAKFGVAKEQRRLLGYHLAPGDRTLEAYSRDSMAAPLRCLDEVLCAISSRDFDPDATRSGNFAARAACRSAPTALPVERGSEGALSPTAPVASDLASVDEAADQAEKTVEVDDAQGDEALQLDDPALLFADMADEAERGVQEDADVESSSSSSLSPASSIASSDEDLPDTPDLPIVFNKLTKKYHIDAGDGRLRDGKRFPRSFARMSAVPPGGRLCTKCF